MKRIFYMSLILLCGIIHAAEEEDVEYIACEKTYVEPQYIHFFGKNIFVQIQDFWVQIPAIRTDKLGFFFESMSMSKYSWTCSDCGKHNEAFMAYCKKCGKPRP